MPEAEFTIFYKNEALSKQHSLGKEEWMNGEQRLNRDLQKLRMNNLCLEMPLVLMLRL